MRCLSLLAGRIFIRLSRLIQPRFLPVSAGGNIPPVCQWSCQCDMFCHLTADVGTAVIPLAGRVTRGDVFSAAPLTAIRDRPEQKRDCRSFSAAHTGDSTLVGACWLHPPSSQITAGASRREAG